MVPVHKFLKIIEGPHSSLNIWHKMLGGTQSEIICERLPQQLTIISIKKITTRGKFTVNLQMINRTCQLSSNKREGDERIVLFNVEFSW